MQCILCGQPYSDERAALGFATCPECGDIDAQRDLNNKHKRIGVAWNKGPEMYLGSPTTTRHILKYEGGRKHLPVLDPDSNRDAKPKTPLSSGQVKRVGRTGGSIPPTGATTKVKWVFSHWRWDTNELGHRVKRAILKKTEKE